MSVSQRYCHKNCRSTIVTHFSRKENKHCKKSFDEQIKNNVNISEGKNQRGKVNIYQADLVINPFMQNVVKWPNIL